MVMLGILTIKSLLKFRTLLKSNNRIRVCANGSTLTASNESVAAKLVGWGGYDAVLSFVDGIASVAAMMTLRSFPRHRY